jgi:tetratricopeptide (TPR) repeat protein
MRFPLIAAVLFLPISAPADTGSYALEFTAARAVEARGDLAVAVEGMKRSYALALEAGNADYMIAAGNSACHLIYRQGKEIEAGKFAREIIGALEPLPVDDSPRGDAVRRVQLFGYLERGLKAEGKLGSAWQANRAAAETLRGKKVTADADGPSITVKEVIAMPPAIRSCGWRLLERESELLDIAGRTVEARKLLDDAAAFLGSDWRRISPVEHFYAFKLLASQAMILDFLGYEREAIAAQQQLFDESEDESQVKSPRLTLHLNLLRNRSQWEGPSEDLLAEARTVGAELKKNPANRDIGRLLAKMELDLRESKEAVDVLREDATRDASAGREFEAVYSGRDSLIARANHGEDGLDPEFFTLLLKMRAQGNKRGEPNLYREYGDYLLDRKRPAEAIAMFGEALRLTRSFGWRLHEGALLYDLFKARFEAGDLDGARAAIAEMEAFLKAHPELPDSRRVPAEVSLALAWAKLGDKDAARAAFARAREAAGNLPEYGKRWLKPDVEARVLASEPVAVPAATVELAKIRLQPLEISSIAVPGKPARTRFIAFNPNAKGARGNLSIEGPGAVAVEGRNLIRFRAGAPLATVKLSRDLSGGGESQVEVSIDAAAGIENAQVHVSWENVAGDLGSPATWEVSWTPDAKRSVVLDASVLEANPFRSVTLFHELAVPDGEFAAIPFRLRSPVALRLEYYDSSSHELIAIDANGNGDFTEAGDLHSRSTDGVAAALLPLPIGKEIPGIEVRISATSGEALPLVSPSLILTSEVHRDGKWTAEAENVLR